jgi:hypothetical protein
MSHCSGVKSLRGQLEAVARKDAQPLLVELLQSFALSQVTLRGGGSGTIPVGATGISVWTT